MRRDRSQGLREAELVNHILAAALRYDLSIGDGDALLGEVEMRTGDGTSAGTAKIKAVDVRYPAASPGNVLAFTMHGASGAIACSALCAGKGEYPALNGAGGRAPSPAEVMQLMVKAARAGLDKQRGLDEWAGRGFVRYPARAGESERSGRRGYDDGSAVATQPSTTTRMPTTTTAAATTTTTCRTSRATILMASTVLK